MIVLFVSAQLMVMIMDISPTRSTGDAADADRATGGRINHLAAVPGNNQVFYAASEWGGLFKTADQGRTWSRLDGHIPVATWDVKVHPHDVNVVFATSFYDGRVNSLSGISVSRDAGVTWTRPATAIPPAGFCTAAVRRNEPSAFGIAIDNVSGSVYIGTNCGLAASTDRGTTWTYVDPTPVDLADDIWSVIVHHGGIIDLCGDDGHRRSTDGGVTWTGATATGTALPGGRCSLAVSPDESYVLFAVAGLTIYESDDGGGDWATTFANPSAQGRIPFVTTNQRGGNAFDLWFGDTRLHRANCTTTIPPVAGPRCPPSNTWAGPFTRTAGAHDDTGDLVFDSQSITNACPVLLSSDGGVYFNTLAASPACHTPAWEQPNVTPRALWLFALAGVNQAGDVNEDLYMGAQDNGTFGARDGGAASPTWVNPDCCDAFDMSPDTTRVVFTVCCNAITGAAALWIRNPGLGGARTAVNTNPPGNILGFADIDSIGLFGAGSYVVVTTA